MYRDGGLNAVDGPETMRIAVIGFGGMGQSLYRSLQKAGPYRIGAALVPEGLQAEATSAGLAVFHSVANLLGWTPDLVVECAGHEALAGSVSPILRAGVDVVVASVGALADQRLAGDLEASARAGGARLTIASGAVGGLDALAAARLAGLASVTYVGRKPPRAWAGTPAGEKLDLDALTEPATIYEGNARDAALLYPRNANVTASIAIAGIGFEDTRVRLVADPSVDRNVHELTVVGAFGSFSVKLENAALPSNVKTSWLAALSIEKSIRSHFDAIRF